MIDELDREIHIALGAILDLAPDAHRAPEASAPTTRRPGLASIAAGLLVVTALGAITWATTRATPAAPIESAPVSTAATTSSTSTSDTVTSSALPSFDATSPWDPQQLVRDTPEHAQLDQRGIEAAIRSCMSKAGLDYRVQLVAAPVTAPGIPDETYRRQYGFGTPPQAPPDTEWDTWITNAMKNGAFATALDGCTGSAYRLIYPPDGAATSPFSAAFNTKQKEFIVAVYGSADHRATRVLDTMLESARADWSACMRSIGVDAFSPGALASRMLSTRASARADVGVTGAEIDIALMDWQCEISTDYVHRWYGRLQALTAQFSDANAPAIAQIKLWQTQVAARAQQAIEAAP